MLLTEKQGNSAGVVWAGGSSCQQGQWEQREPAAVVSCGWKILWVDRNVNCCLRSLCNNWSKSHTSWNLHFPFYVCKMSIDASSLCSYLVSAILSAKPDVGYGCWYRGVSSVGCSSPRVHSAVLLGEDHRGLGMRCAVAKLPHHSLGSPELWVQFSLKPSLQTAGCNSACSLYCCNSKRSMYKVGTYN